MAPFRQSSLGAFWEKTSETVRVSTGHWSVSTTGGGTEAPKTKICTEICCADPTRPGLASTRGAQ